MVTPTKHLSTVSLLLLAGIGTCLQSASAADESNNPLYADGPYVGVMGVGQYSAEKDNKLDLGGGIDAFGGYRKGAIALEAGANYVRASGANLIGGEVNALVFPMKSLPGLFGLGGVGVYNIHGYPGLKDIEYGENFNIHAVNAGAGYLFPLKVGSSTWGLRAEGLFRYGKYDNRIRDQRPPNGPLPVPDKWYDLILRVGVLIPLGRVVPEPAPLPAAVVPVTDADGDGVLDDADQCPGTPAGVAVDAKGCPLAPPCKVPEPGQTLSLKGCATGDVIILRGVNFEFDKSRLTPNAETILDGVASELVANPKIEIELNGYTDAKGSDGYNQKLSESRAAAVLTYLADHGVDRARMTSKGYGESQPVSDNDTDEGRELNRRVELKIVSNPDNAAVSSTGSEGQAAAVAPETPSSASGAEGVEPVAEPVDPGAAAAPPADTPVPVPSN